MATQSAGIQKLLQAEKRAKEKVDEARRRKALRLKQAKEEAHMEIEQFKKENELKFKEKEQEIMGSKDDVEADVEKVTVEKVKKQRQELANNKAKTIDLLLAKVVDVRPSVHQNYRADAAQ